MEEAIASNDIEKIKELLQDGYDPSEKNATGRPIIFDSENIEIIELFLNYGLDPKITDIHGFTMENYTDDLVLKEKLNETRNPIIINPPKFIKYRATKKAEGKRSKTRRNQVVKSL
jgi:hypothetical protein